jgi:nucleolin
MANNEEAKLFVAGLPDSVTEEVLRQIFEATGGSVLNVSLPKHRETGRPRGFGFVTMSTPQEAQSARDALDGSMQGGRSISVRPFLAEAPRKSDSPMSQGPRSFGAGPPRSSGPGGAQSPDRTLYVGNLPYDTSQQEVETLVQGVAGEGQVLRVHLPTDPDGRKRGFGFVTMASSESAKTAADALKNADIRGRRLIVNIAHPKGDRPPPSRGGDGPYSDRGGGGFSGGPPSFGGGPPSFGAAPPASRRTFDTDRRRKQHGAGGPEGEGGAPPGPGGRKPRGGGGSRRERPEDIDWGEDD